jgi:PAS domain S-box-containing protein
MPDGSLKKIKEKFYRSLAESAYDYIFVVDLDFNVSYCNEYCARALDKASDQIIGQPLLALFPAEVAGRQKAALQQVIDTRRPMTSDSLFAFPNSQVWLSTSLSPLFNENKELISILGISRDISVQKHIEAERAKELDQLRLFQRLAVDRELKLMEIEQGIESRDAALAKLKEQIAADRQTLARTEKKYLMLLDSAPVAIGIADESGRVLEINKAMEEMTGYTFDDYRQLKLADTYCDPADRERLLGLMQSRTNVHNFPVCLKHKNGTIYTALLNADMTEVGGQKIVVTTCRDISELMRVRKLLQENEEKIKRYESESAGPELKGPEN